MAVAEHPYSRRRARAVDKKAAKARRQKIILVVAGVLLLGLLAIQLPRTLRMLNPPADPAAAPTAAAPAAGAPTQRRDGISYGARVARFVRLVESLSFNDPFIVRPIRANTSVPAGARGPADRDPFVQKRIVAEAGALTGPAPVARGNEDGRGADSAGGYTIVLASVPRGAGRAAAAHAALRARTAGLPAVGVLKSSNYRSLRPGYNVVFTKVYPTLAAATRALRYVRARGYPNAYTRRLGK